MKRPASADGDNQAKRQASGAQWGGGRKDRNNDGFISVEEYKAVTHDIFLLANEKKISTSNKDQLMKSSFGDMDLNMDGFVKLMI